MMSSTVKESKCKIFNSIHLLAVKLSDNHWVTVKEIA